MILIIVCHCLSSVISHCLSFAVVVCQCLLFVDFAVFCQSFFVFVVCDCLSFVVVFLVLFFVV